MQNIEVQGVEIPRLGYGTWQLRGSACQEAVEGALARGYRHLDTATMYANEDAVGAAIAAAGLPRDEIFVTTKVWPDKLAPDALRRSFDASLAALKLDHVDLFLIHWPAPDMDLAASLEVMMGLREAGRTRAIGVCNFNLPLMRQAVEEIGAPIAVNQVEYHPFLDQSRLLGYLRGHGIALTGYAPLAQGRAASDETLARIGEKHGASAAQVAIAWLLDQDGVIAIPKAASAASQTANLDALNIKLDDADRAAIAALPKNLRYVSGGWAPDWDAE